MKSFVFVTPDHFPWGKKIVCLIYLRGKKGNELMIYFITKLKIT